jgi:hypothetical protein
LGTGFGSIYASINGSEVDPGFIIFTKNGALACLEGYTCLADWPDVITSYTLYHYDEIKQS